MSGSVLELGIRAKSYLVQHSLMMSAVATECIPDLVSMAQTVAEAFQRGNKLFLFGNGGSAADAQHIAAEFVNRFRRDRRPLPAIALTTDSSVITAIANDVDFDDLFIPQIEALAKDGDVLLGISTSGDSPNVLRALSDTPDFKLSRFLWTGSSSHNFGWITYLRIPSTITSHIQEAHIVCGHILCDLVDEIMFGEMDAS